MGKAELRKYIRRAVTAIASFLLVLLLGEFIVSYGHEQGWFSNVTGKVNTVMNYFSAIIYSQYFVYLCLVVAGLTAGLWTDLLLKKREDELPLGVDFRNAGDLARRQAIYIQKNEPLRKLFTHFLVNGGDKISPARQTHAHISYLVNNKLIESSADAAPSDDDGSIWYFATDQAKLVQEELAELNRDMMANIRSKRVTRA